MADEEVRPAPGEPGAGAVESEAMPDSGGRSSDRDSPPVDGAAARERSTADFDTAPSSAVGPAVPRRSALPALLAIIGLILIALLGINLYMMANPPDRAQLPALQAEVSGLTQRVGALEARPGAGSALASVEDRLKTLDASVAQLSSDLSDTRSKLASAPAPDPNAGDAVTSKLDALDKRAGALDEAVAGLKQAVASVPRLDLTPLETKATDLQTGVDQLKAGLAAVPRVDLGPLETKTASLETKTGSLETKTGSLQSSTASLDQRVKPLEAALTTSRLYAAPLAVAAQSILQALDDGRPFTSEVGVLQALGADEAKLAPLRALAAKGAPTRSQLVAGFAASREAMVQASAPVVTGTMLDRMMASAEGLVKVRPAGASPGSDPDAVAGRIAADLDSGDFHAALGEWQHLPDASRSGSAAWAGELKQRVDAEDAARSIASGAFAALAPTQ